MSMFDPGTKEAAAGDQRVRSEMAGWLATVARDGTPQSSPVSFLWDGEHILMWPVRP